MEPVRVSVNRIIDYGRTVTIVGVDLMSNEPVMVHVDHRSYDTVLAAQNLSDKNKPSVFEATGLTLRLDINLDTDDENTSPKHAA